MNLVDSSAWLEYFADTPRAKLFAPAIEDTSRLLVPTLSVYEVFKKVRRDRGEGDALLTISAMLEARVIDLDTVMPGEGAAARNTHTRFASPDGGVTDTWGISSGRT